MVVIVQKYAGTSVCSVERIQAVAKTVKAGGNSLLIKCLLIVNGSYHFQDQFLTALANCQVYGNKIIYD